MEKGSLQPRQNQIQAEEYLHFLDLIDCNLLASDFTDLIIRSKNSKQLDVETQRLLL